MFTTRVCILQAVSFIVLNLLHLLFVYTRRCAAETPVTADVRVLVTDVNELLKTIWQYLCV